MITNPSKLFVAGCAVVLLALSAMPAMAMRLEGEVLPSQRTVKHESNAPVASSAVQPAAAEETAPVIVVVQQPATLTVDAGPVAQAPGTKAEDRSGHGEAEKPEVQKPEAETPDTAAPSGAPALPPSQIEPEQAKAVELEHGPEVEFKGTVELMSGVSPTLTLTVSGRIVTTTAQTVFLNPVNIGDFVEVDGFLQPDQAVWAKKIKLDDNPVVELEVEFRGRIAALPNDPNWLGTWVIGTYTVTADANTDIDTQHGQPVIGAIAEVKAERQPDNSLLAVRIKLEDESEFENEAELKGTISNLTGSGPYSMQVAGHTVTTDAATVIAGTLANGVLVEVHGTRQPDDSVLATQITVEDPINDELEFTAHVTTLPVDFMGAWTFDNGKTVTVDANTLIDQSRGAAQIGALAQVKAVKQLDGTWLAVRIQIEDN